MVNTQSQINILSNSKTKGENIKACTVCSGHAARQQQRIQTPGCQNTTKQLNPGHRETI